MSTVDPNAPKPSRRRASAASTDPRVEDASGGTPRPRARVNRTGAGRGRSAITVDTDEPSLDDGPEVRWDGDPAEEDAVADRPESVVATAPPVTGSSSVDAAIPTGAMPVVDAPSGRAVTRTAPEVPLPIVDPTPPPPPTVAETASQPVSDFAATDPLPTTVQPAVVAGPAEHASTSRAVIWRRTTRPRVRRVTRVLRHVDTWSVFKVALVFNVVAYLVALTAAVLLWNVAYRTGTIDNVEKFFEQFGWETFEFKGGELYHNLWIAGLFVAVGLTGFAVLLATVFNLVTDLVGGIRVSVLEEEVITRASTSRSRSSVPVSSASAGPPTEPVPTADPGRSGSG